MRILFILLLSVCLSGIVIAEEKTENKIFNRLIDYKGFQNAVNSFSNERETKRLTEEDFLKMIENEDVILLDARSESRYKLRHIKSALSRSLASLAVKL
ncbi:rhodanese-like protein [Leptospira alexanderi serovar Manhao 3 str. L 60]|uniref:Rhodanese-like protein n=1 Tax=Leptospira alexanderi serovar Manhao 3 str. L 60 TaxID=1049759 RepID=V6HSZ6_9LEPT|nr:rhodanese-like protein [Leptospira alexanderi serovar Manhao 3 str. L 60]